MQALLTNTDRGIYCPAGDFYIDPWRPVDCAIITHAHSDHARWGSKLYVTAEQGGEILRERLGQGINVQTLRYEERIERNGVTVSLHPAGHILGSAQVRVEYKGQVAVVSGDYKLENDGLCPPFEPVRCHLFVTESTFGLPIYRWPSQSEVFSEINEWWRENRSKGRTSVLFGYSLGKAQRLLSGVDPAIGPIFLHGSVSKFLPAYRRAGARLPEPQEITPQTVKSAQGSGLVIAPPSADNTPWLRRFGDYSNAFASGWMQIRGTRRRRALDRGFVLSDHVDWKSLLEAVKATEAPEVWVTHGYTEPVVRWLNEKGLQAKAIKTRFEGEMGSEEEAVAPEDTKETNETTARPVKEDLS